MNDPMTHPSSGVGNSVVEVISRDVIHSRVRELGAQIGADYPDKTPVFVGVLNGSAPFLADLVRACPIDLEVDFLGITRFGDGGQVDISVDCATDLTGRHVVLVEDIVDTGLTLRSVRSMIEIRQPASLVTVTLIDKAARRLVDVPLEYRGFEVGDEFLLGYGMDWENAYRNLQGIWAVLDFESFADDPDSLGRVAFAEAARLRQRQ